jgi:hypothetical protein
MRTALVTLALALMAPTGLWGAFPTIEATNSGDSEGPASTHTVNLPSGITPGSLVIVIFALDGKGEIDWPLGWMHQLFSAANGADSRLAAAYRICDGTEGGTITVRTTTTKTSAHITYRIENYSGEPEAGKAVTGKGTWADPPQLTPSWGAADTLWLAVADRDSDAYPRNIQSYPPNYSNVIESYWDHTEGVWLACGARELNAASEDPDTYVLWAPDQWIAQTIAIRPAAVGGAADGKAQPTSP